MSRLPAPARRALEGAGIHTIEQLASQTETELLRLHGFGKASLPVLKEALREAGLSFRTELKS
jgi:DNA-directed RNA polymerase alpha subunit